MKVYNIGVIGALGRMGQTCLSLLEAQDCFHISLALVAEDDALKNKKVFPDKELLYTSKLDNSLNLDAIIDFSFASVILEHANYAKKLNSAYIVGVTGLDDKTINGLKEISKSIPLIWEQNFSIGMTLLTKLSQLALKSMKENEPDIEIIEAHHHNKIDAPSGSAKKIFDALKAEDDALYPSYERNSRREKRNLKEVGMHSIRAGSIVGEHEVLFALPDEVLKLSHAALSREIFANGAITAMKYLLKQKAPKMYTMEDVLGLK